MEAPLAGVFDAANGGAESGAYVALQLATARHLVHNRPSRQVIGALQRALFQVARFDIQEALQSIRSIRQDVSRYFHFLGYSYKSCLTSGVDMETRVEGAMTR